MTGFQQALLVAGAFWLGACPFSVWIGRRLLRKEIREFGDGNPGAANVFRAGGLKVGCLAVVLDVAKGVPFVALAHGVFEFSEVAVAAVALGAILGHAFSPLLRFRGGKSIAVTFGVLLALPEHEMLLAFTVCMFLGFLLVDDDAWTAILGAAGSTAYLAATGAGLPELLLMVCVLGVFGLKQFPDLQTFPIPRVRLAMWLQWRRRGL